MAPQGIPAPDKDLRVQLYSAVSSATNGTDPGTALATLSGPAQPSVNSTAVYTCSGSGCELAPGATYYVVLSVPTVVGTTGQAYHWQRSGTNNETASPAGSGFSIANEIRQTTDGGATWDRRVRVAMFRVEYAEPALAASAITTTTATLTLTDYAGAWHYQADTGPDATCQGPVAAGTSTESLTGLTVGTTYTYTAYTAAGCASADAITANGASVTTTFTTP